MGHAAHTNDKLHLDALPSPASLSLGSPILEKALGSAFASPTCCDLLGILPSEPDSTTGAPLAPMSPPAVEDTEPDLMNLVTGGALAPVNPNPPPARAASPRMGPGLRLPSFEELGIGARQHIGDATVLQCIETLTPPADGHPLSDSPDPSLSQPADSSPSGGSSRPSHAPSPSSSSVAQPRSFYDDAVDALCKPVSNPFVLLKI